MTDLERQGAQAQAAARVLAIASTEKKNQALEAIAAALTARSGEWLAANAKDIEVARKAGMRESLIDRLLLTETRVEQIASAVREVIDLPDPVPVK